MGSIVAIGGGDVSTLVTQPIDEAIIALSGSSHPKALFIPTASSDSVENWEGFDRAYRESYGCETDVLYLLGSTPSPESIASKIDWADVIYVGGGNTLKMMRRWRLLGVDVLLRAAHERGVVLCGVSAGAICWFDRGHSDSMSFYSPDDWNYIAVTGMGLLSGLACPHYNGDTAGQSHLNGTGVVEGQQGVVVGCGKLWRLARVRASSQWRIAHERYRRRHTHREPVRQAFDPV